MLIDDAPQELLTKILEWCSLITKLPTPFIAGGFVREFYTGGEPSDMDIFFPNEECFKYAVKTVETSELYLTACESPTAMTYELKEGEKKNRIQLISWSYGDPDCILNQFDFIMCMAGVNWITKKLHMHANFKKHLEEKKMVYNPHPRFRVTTLQRLVKFGARGFTISYHDLNLIAIDIKKTDEANLKSNGLKIHKADGSVEEISDYA